MAQAFISRLANLELAGQPISDMGLILNVRAELDYGVGLEANMSTDRSSSLVVGTRSARLAVTFGKPANGESLPVFDGIDWAAQQYNIVLYDATNIYNPAESTGGQTLTLMNVAPATESDSWSNMLRAATDAVFFVATNFQITPAPASS